MYKLFMEFENPTLDYVGIRRSVQGFAIHEDLGFVLFHTGICGIYNLKTKEKKPLAVFKLGSFNEGVPDKRYANHANDAVFGAKLPADAIPLMYVTAGNSGECDENGYISYCAVERITREDGNYKSETIQRIFYKNDGIEATPYHAPGWGWPASLADTDGGFYYMLASKYRSKREFTKPDNVYTLTKFRLPDPLKGDVTLYPKDILDQYDLPCNILHTQGGTVKDGHIWYMFGAGKEIHPNGMNVIDLKKREYAFFEDLSDAPFANEE
ncbi:MAG: hypothetical protein IKD18_04525, partial [Clostridia bacterium]|nr:hypothetical protein [Clostridia bacterium]